MTTFIIFMLKSALSVTFFVLSYRLLFSRVTFYRLNRYYFIGSIGLSLILPFVTIGMLQSSPRPLLINLTDLHANPEGNLATPAWQIAGFLLLMLGIVVMGTLFFIKLVSVKNIRRRSVAFRDLPGAKVFATGAPISPFSFDRSIFVNPSLHSDEELRDILRHELVHVEQNHTIDLVFAELLCIVNWFNPFAWMLRSDIRQNLEYLADREVIADGADRQSYQHLLLKLAAGPQQPLANHLSLSNLKNRIMMMNKTKSTATNLYRLLLLIPVIGLVVIACSKEDATRTNGAPTALRSDTIRIGVRTAASPIFVIDQVRQPGTFKIGSISPAQIQSITVWKDESARAKFGDDAKDGVVEIELKHK